MFRGLERFSVSAPGRVVNEYRIHRDKLELRTWNLQGRMPKQWRKVEPDEIMLHLLLNTAVGQWLMSRRGFDLEASLLHTRSLHKAAA
ncbi:MAG: DUF4178 domain-containing protein [Acidobacteriales bacterium]|nr:DUF4178 domain-containing protein [Terriglobales bacterium]